MPGLAAPGTVPKRRPSIAGTGWPRLGAGGVRSSLSAAGTDARAAMKRRGCGRVVNPSVSPPGTGHNYSRSSLSAEGTAGNSPGIHSWGSGARADMRSPESRRDGGGSAGLVFRRPYGTRLVDLLPSNPGLRLWLRPGLFRVVPTGLGGGAHPARLFVHPRVRQSLFLPPTGHIIVLPCGQGSVWLLLLAVSWAVEKGMTCPEHC